MEPRQQIEKWQRQASEYGDDASANMLVAKRLMKHGIESLDLIEKQQQALRELVCAMRKYQMDAEVVDDDPAPVEHRNMMERAERLLPYNAR